MPQGVAHYGRRKGDVGWGPCIPYQAAYTEYTALQPEVWADRPEVLDAGMTDDYAQYFHTHPFPRFTVLDEARAIRVAPQPGAGIQGGVAGGE